MGADKKLIVVSAVALRSGGPLTIVRNVLDYLDSHLSRKYRIKALVYSADVYSAQNSGVEIIVVKGGDNYVSRLKLEYLTFRKWSLEWEPYLWLSLHDMSPRVFAERQAVYCHNPSPFYRPSVKAAFHSPTVTMFSLFYKYLYRINIGRNDFVVVQQDWLRSAFKKMFPIKGNIIVAYPDQPSSNAPVSVQRKKVSSDTVFIYPAYPRIFKNHEVLLRAFRQLLKNGQAPNARLLLTIDGTENKYSEDLVARFGNLKNVDFMGLMPHQKVLELMDKADCLLFPSKLETWGLPITEAKTIGLPIMAADLPYTHETISNYDQVRFFSPDDYQELARLIAGYCKKEKTFFPHLQQEPAPLFTKSWEQLFNYMLEKTV